MTTFHKPVLLKEVIEHLSIKKDKQYIDATLGGGGHTLEIVKAAGLVLGIDQDPEALRAAKKKLSAYPSSQLKIVKGNFNDIAQIASKNGFSNVSGILFDLGASTHQLTNQYRGFSLMSNARLDMRMNPDLKVTAHDLINGLGRKELTKLFTIYAQEKYVQPIVRAVIDYRKNKPINTTGQLADLIERIYPAKRGRLHPATKVFQALRLAVNDELNNLKEALPQAVSLLKKTGKLVCISFHQGEDRIVKQFFKKQADEQKLKIITKKPLIANHQEITSNPNASSAKLRTAVKL